MAQRPSAAYFPTDTLKFVKAKGNLPIIKVNYQGKDLILFMDSGASFSILDKKVAKKNKIPYHNDYKRMRGFGGSVKVLSTNYGYVETSRGRFQEQFQIADLSEIISVLREKTGVDIDGILGSQIYNKHFPIINLKDSLVIFHYLRELENNDQQ